MKSLSKKIFIYSLQFIAVALYSSHLVSNLAYGELETSSTMTCAEMAKQTDEKAELSKYIDSLKASEEAPSALGPKIGFCVFQVMLANLPKDTDVFGLKDDEKKLTKMESLFDILKNIKHIDSAKFRVPLFNFLTQKAKGLDLLRTIGGQDGVKDHGTIQFSDLFGHQINLNEEKQVASINATLGYLAANEPKADLCQEQEEGTKPNASSRESFLDNLKPSIECGLTRPDVKRILSIIDAAAVDTSGPNDASTCSPVDPDGKEQVTFAKELWAQSMANLVVSKIDLAMRYTQDLINRAPDPNVDPTISEFINLGESAQNVSNNLGFLKKQANRYVKSFRAKNIQAMTPDEVVVDLKARKNALKEVYQQTIKSASQDGPSAFTRERAEYDAAEAEIYGVGAGILYYTEALNKKINLYSVNPFQGWLMSRIAGIEPVLKIQPDATLVRQAILEMETNIKNAASQLNYYMNWALSNPYEKTNKNTSINLASVLKMIEANPLAVGQVLKRNPAFKKHICFYLRKIEKSRETIDVCLNGLHGVMLGTMVIGGVSALPDLLLMKLSTEATAKLITIRAVNGIVGQTAFAVTSATDLATVYFKGRAVVRQGIALTTGGGYSPADLTAAQNEENSAIKDIVTDIQFAALPKIAKSFTVTRGATKMPKLSMLVDQLKKIQSKFDTKQWQAGFHIFNILCGTVDTRCALLLSAFEGLPVEKQKEIFDSREKIEKFIKQELGDKETSQTIIVSEEKGSVEFGDPKARDFEVMTDDLRAEESKRLEFYSYFKITINKVFPRNTFQDEEVFFIHDDRFYQGNIIEVKNGDNPGTAKIKVKLPSTTIVELDSKKSEIRFKKKISEVRQKIEQSAARILEPSTLISEPFPNAFLNQIDNDVKLNERFKNLKQFEFIEEITNAKVNTVADISHRGNKVYVVELDNGAVGVFKPYFRAEAQLVVGLPFNSGDPINEVVSYAIDQYYDLNLVPKTALLTITQDSKKVEGSFMLYEPNTISGKMNAHSPNPIVMNEIDMAKTDCFDYLLTEADRHKGNYLIRPNGSIVAIDNGISSWQGEAFVSMRLLKNSKVGLSAARDLSPKEIGLLLAQSGRGFNSLNNPKRMKKFIETKEGKAFVEKLRLSNAEAIEKELRLQIPNLSNRIAKTNATRINRRREALLKEINEIIKYYQE